MCMQKTVLLSYDVEEFDMPFEYEGNLPFDEQVRITTNGLEKLLMLLDKYNIKVTFYCTATYALAKKEIIQQLNAAGHEIASHAYYHSTFKVEDLQKSKDVLEEITGNTVSGFRMPRMMPVDIDALKQAGYFYNSSLNPTWLPGRYNHLTKPKLLFKEKEMWQLPGSVTPVFRIPLFWLSFHNFPFWLYWHFCKRALNNAGYVNLYFHPWEFYDYRNAGNAKFPGYVTKNCGDTYLVRTEKLIVNALKAGCKFETTIDWLHAKAESV